MRKRVDYKAHIENSLPIEEVTRYNVHHYMVYTTYDSVISGIEMKNTANKFISFSTVFAKRINKK